MSDKNQGHAPKIFTDEEIEMFLAGDRRQIDRHILYSLNRIAAVLIPHVDREKDLIAQIDAVGGFPAIETRAEYVDSLIKRNDTRAAMMRKVAESTVTWALIAFAAFLASAVWNDVIAAVRAALKIKGS